MNKLIVAILVPLLAACSATAPEKTYKGTYSYGHEVRSFKPCNEKEDYWVSFDWAGMEMQDFYEDSGKRPYQPLYIEFRGQILNETVDGFAEQSSGLIRISEVLSYTFEVPSGCN